MYRKQDEKSENFGTSMTKTTFDRIKYVQRFRNTKRKNEIQASLVTRTTDLVLMDFNHHALFLTLSLSLSMCGREMKMEQKVIYACE